MTDLYLCTIFLSFILFLNIGLLSRIVEISEIPKEFLEFKSVIHNFEIKSMSFENFLEILKLRIEKSN